MLPIINRKIVFPIIQLVSNEPISRCLLELNKTQWNSHFQLKELQWLKLKKIINHCYYNIPFYGKRFDKLKLTPEHIKSFEDLKQLPYLEKEDLRLNFSELQNENNRKSNIEHCHSGGTLGSPLNIIRDSISSAYTRAAQLRGLSWYGIRKGDRQLRIWGLPFDNKLAQKERKKDFFLNRLRISAFDISRKQVLNYFKIMKRFKPKYVYGFTSAIYKICQLMAEEKLSGEELNIKYVVTTTETLFPYQRKYIESFLNCRVINEYGCGEVGIISFECPRGKLHISMENLLVEFVDNPHIQSKEIILTNLNSFSMPLLRYRIGDTGSIIESNCSCGRGLEIMDFNAGRVFSTLMGTDGRFVAGNVFAYIAWDIIERYNGIKDFRVVQKQKNKIEITLSKGEKFTEDILNLFTKKIKNLLGQDMLVEYKFLDEIPLEKSGKRLFVYSELEEII